MSPLVLTPGDPDGIGPEVTAQALVGLERPVVVVGDAVAFERAARSAGLDCSRVDQWPASPAGVSLR